MACTGRQRVKTAAMQSGGRVCLEDAAPWWLRSLQAYEYEAGVSTFNGVFSVLGYMPVLPGPCALLRFDQCMADGGVDESASGAGASTRAEGSITGTWPP